MSNSLGEFGIIKNAKRDFDIQQFKMHQKPIHAEGRHWDWLATAYAIGILVIMAYNIRPYTYINDEVTYTLMVDSLTHGTFKIENGLDEFNSKELILPSTARYGRNLYSIYPPVYSILMQPFYIPLKVWGLIAANTLSAAAVLILVYLTTDTLFRDKRFAFYTMVFYSLFTYSIKYSIEIWPHMLSLALVLGSYYLALRGRWFYACGLLAGLSVGVRYANILLAGVLLLYILSLYGWKKAIAFITGMSPTITALILLNYSFSGNLLKTGYNNDSESIRFQIDLIPYLFVSSLVAFTVYAVARRAHRKLALPAVALALALLLTTAYALDPQFLKKTTDSIRIVYAEVYDIQSHPLGDVTPIKKSLLQASPILVLSIFAGARMRGRIRDGNILLLAAPAVTLTLFYSCFYNVHGGQTPFMRYLLESVPYLAIMSAYTIKEWKCIKFDKNDLLTFGFMTILFISLSMASNIDRSLITAYDRNLPHLLTITLLAAGLLRTKAGPVIVSTLVLAAMAFGLSVNINDSVYTKVSRESNTLMVNELENIRNDSVLVIADNIDYITAGLIKVNKDVRIVDASADNASDAPAIIKYYYNRGTPVYILYSNKTDEYPMFINSISKAYDNTVIDGRYTKIYLLVRGEGKNARGDA